MENKHTMKIKTVFFDIGGVLLNIHPEHTVNHISNIVKMPENDVRKLFPFEAHYQYEKGQITDQEFYTAVHQRLPRGKFISEDEFWVAWRKLVGEETGESKLLIELKKNFQVWLLSNTNARHIENGVSSTFSFFQEIDGAIYSYQVGSRKPEPNIFLQALQKADTKAEQALFIDDFIENIEQAKSMGFQTIHFKPTTDLKAELQKLGISI